MFWCLFGIGSREKCENFTALDCYAKWPYKHTETGERKTLKILNRQKNLYIIIDLTKGAVSEYQKLWFDSCLSYNYSCISGIYFIKNNFFLKYKMCVLIL